MKNALLSGVLVFGACVATDADMASDPGALGATTAVTPRFDDTVQMLAGGYAYQSTLPGEAPQSHKWPRCYSIYSNHPPTGSPGMLDAESDVSECPATRAMSCPRGVTAGATTWCPLYQFQISKFAPDERLDPADLVHDGWVADAEEHDLAGRTIFRLRNAHRGACASTELTFDVMQRENRGFVPRTGTVASEISAGGYRALTLSFEARQEQARVGQACLAPDGATHTSAAHVESQLMVRYEMDGTLIGQNTITMDMFGAGLVGNPSPDPSYPEVKRYLASCRNPALSETNFTATCNVYTSDAVYDTISNVTSPILPPGYKKYTVDLKARLVRYMHAGYLKNHAELVTAFNKNVDDYNLAHPQQPPRPRVNLNGVATQYVHSVTFHTGAVDGVIDVRIVNPRFYGTALAAP